MESSNSIENNHEPSSLLAR